MFINNPGVKNSLSLLIVIVFIVFSNGCSAGVSSKPSTYPEFINDQNSKLKFSFVSSKDPFISSNIDVSQKSSYYLSFLSKENSITEKKLLFVIHEYLNVLGWNRLENPDIADYIFTISFSVEEVERTGKKRVPNGKELMTNWNGTPMTDMWGNPMYQDKYETKIYQYATNLRLFNLNVLSSDNSVLWSLNIDSEGESKDLIAVGEAILKTAIRSAFFLDTTGENLRTGEFSGCMDINASNFCKFCTISNNLKCTYASDMLAQENSDQSNWTQSQKNIVIKECKQNFTLTTDVCECNIECCEKLQISYEQYKAFETKKIWTLKEKDMSDAWEDCFSTNCYSP